MAVVQVHRAVRPAPAARVLAVGLRVVVVRVQVGEEQMKKYIVIHLVTVLLLFLYPLAIYFEWVSLSSNHSISNIFILLVGLNLLCCLMITFVSGWNIRSIKNLLLSLVFLLLGLLAWESIVQKVNLNALKARFERTLSLCNISNPSFCLHAFHDYTSLHPSSDRLLDYREQRLIWLKSFYPYAQHVGIDIKDYVVLMSSEYILTDLEKIFPIPVLSDIQKTLLKDAHRKNCKESEFKNNARTDLIHYWKIRADWLCAE